MKKMFWNRWKWNHYYNKCFVEQAGFMDCGIACLQMVLKSFGIHMSNSNLRTLTGFAAEGTNLLGLYRAAEKLGLHVVCGRLTDMEIKDMPTPGILHFVLHNGASHFVVCFQILTEKGNAQYLIGDPGDRLRWWSESELESLWISKIGLFIKPKVPILVTQASVHSKSSIWIILKQSLQSRYIAAGIGMLIVCLGFLYSFFIEWLANSSLNRPSYVTIWSTLGCLFGIWIIKDGLACIRSILIHKQTQSFNIPFVEHIFKRLQQIPLHYLENRSIAELKARVDDLQYVQLAVMHISATLFIDAAVILAGILVLYTYGIIYSIWILASLVVGLCYTYMQYPHLFQFQKSVLRFQNQFASHSLQFLQKLGFLKQRNAHPTFWNKVQQAHQHFETHQLNLHVKYAKFQLGISILHSIFLMLCLIQGIYQYYYKSLPLGSLLAIMGVVCMVLPAVNQVALSVIPFINAKAAMDRLQALWQYFKEPTAKSTEIPPLHSLEVMNAEIELPNRLVSIKIPSLRLEKGAVYGISGRSGVGKSTFLKSLLQPKRFGMQVKLNETLAIENLEEEEWMQQCYLLTDDPPLLEGTLLQNIVLHTNPIEEIQVLEQLQKWDCAKFIKRFQQGLHTTIASDPVLLSAGERQLIGFLRLLYSLPPILLLDEASSKMDARLQSHFLNLLNDIKKDRIVLLVSHQSSVLNLYCDQIVVMEG
jgi:ABC-type bacteriocin/lantibiotic exporter with double-glycine peptidase domain